MTAGALDPTFGSGGISVPTAKEVHGGSGGMAIYSSDHAATAGDIVMAGWISSRNSVDFGAIRYTPSGQPDTTFGNGGVVKTHFKSYFISEASAVAIQANGKIVVAGTAFPKSPGTMGADFAVVRYNVNGSLDTKFGSKGKVFTNVGNSTIGFEDYARGAFLQPDGKIVVVGNIIDPGSAASNVALVRYQANGALDSSFGSGGKAITSHTLIPGSYVDPAGQYGSTWVNGTVLQPDGKMLVSGYTVVSVGAFATPPTSGNTYEAFVLRYDANGMLDTDFGTGGVVVLPPQAFSSQAPTESAGEIALAPNGEIVLTGLNQLALLHSDGSLDAAFGQGGIVPTGVGLVAIQANGDIVTASKSTTGLVSRFLPNGTPDLSFGSGGSERPINFAATGLAIQPDGKIVEVSFFKIARLLPGEPEIGSFAASANTLTAAASVLLTAANITDSNPGSTVTQVAFYAQVNGASTLLGYGTQTSPGTWTFTLSRPADWSAGTYTISAEAKDNFGVLGNLLSLDLNVV